MSNLFITEHGAVIFGVPARIEDNFKLYYTLIPEGGTDFVDSPHLTAVYNDEILKPLSDENEKKYMTLMALNFKQAIILRGIQEDHNRYDRYRAANEK